MTSALTPRARAREENLVRIQQIALGQLADSGPAALSLREIAKEMGLVSSGIYRYYPSRDALLTDLIVAAYLDLAGSLGVRSGTRAVAHAMRDWAVAQPHRFQLIYGTPVAGYAAPDATVEPAAAVVGAFLTGCHDVLPVQRLPRGTATSLSRVSSGLAVDRPREQIAAALLVFSQLVGVITLELGGHLVGTFDDGRQLVEMVAAGASG